jgi:hypothetical protein
MVTKAGWARWVLSGQSVEEDLDRARTALQATCRLRPRWAEGEL